MAVDGERLQKEFSPNSNAAVFGQKNSLTPPQAYEKLIKLDFSRKSALNYIYPGLGDFILDELKKREVLGCASKVIFNPSSKEVFTYVEGKDEKTFDYDKIFDDTAKQLGANEINLQIDCVFKKAETIEHLKSITVKRASFSTGYSSSSTNRKHNIFLAAQKISGIMINPGEVFSFNETVGPRTAERGFRLAPIITYGKFEDGIGGGVCQVSTTLYNCALLAGLEAVSFSRHSLPVGYVEPSFDAMVSSKTDLKIKNTSKYPIYIKMTADGEKLSVTIYGEKAPTIRRRSVTTEVIPFETVTENDPNLKKGEVKVLFNGKNGLKSKGYLDYIVDGKVVKSILIRTDVYLPQPARIAIGTMEDEINLDTAPKQ